jgi:nucleoside-diphosphate-sugar epimerase
MSPLVDSAPQLIFGCGYLGQRVAKLWVASDHRVVALTRNNASILRELAVEPLIGDVCDRDSLKALPAASTVLYAVGLDRAAGRSMREVYVGGLANVLDTLPRCERFVYISATSVYGQTNGESVTESSPTAPTEDAGRIVLEAEQLLRSKRPDAIILRFAGLYGPNRLLRKQPILKGEPLSGDANKWLNLVHVDDGASAVLCAESRGAPGETYNVADGAPVSRRAFYALLAELLHAPPATFERRDEPGAPNRRIVADKFRELVWWPLYASYREGLTSAVAESTM